MSDPLAPTDADEDRTIIRPLSARQPSAADASTAQPTSGTTSPNMTAAAPRDNTLELGTYVGEFEIQAVLGEGGFGIVYLAWDHSLERKVALKEYMPSSLATRGQGLTVVIKSQRHQETFEAGLRSFVNEAKLLAQFDHPSVVKVYRFWEANGTAYMVMPFYEGTTVKDTLKTMDQAPDEAWLMQILTPISEALAVLHHHQCYHRDIAPDNIILLKDTQKPLLLDFGAARRVIGDMTQALTVILKSGYAPVEQYAEVPGMKQGPWTDIYALAATVYFSITGKTPPPSVGRLVNDSYVPLAQCASGRYSASFLQAIDRALLVKPDERTQNMAEFRQDLGLHTTTATTLHMPQPVGATPQQTARGHTRQRSRSRTPIFVAAGLVALAGLGAGAYALLNTGTAQPPSASANAPLTGAATPSAIADAPALAPPAPAPVAKDPFNAVQELKRITENASAGFRVEATASKPRFRIGSDQLKFSFTSSRDGFAYVLLISTDGAFMKLYPNKMSKPNRVNAGQHITLPDSSWPLDVAGPAGTDHFVVIVSENPRDFSALGDVSEEGFTIFPPERAAQVYEAHSGPGSAFAGQAVCSNGMTPCNADYGAAYFTLEEYE